MTVALAVTWFPRGELARILRYWPRIEAIYDHIAIALPPDTDEATQQAVAKLPKAQVRKMSVLGQGRYESVAMALETDAAYIHYADMDRLIRWVETRPDELEQTVGAMQDTDFVMIGRTEYAFGTHPHALQETERIVHDVFSHMLGGTYDFCAGSKGMTRAAAEFLMQHARTDYGLGTDCEWPVLLHRGGFTLGSMLVDGLDWETADRFLDAAADPDTQRRAAEKYDAEATSWAMRVDVAYRIVKAGLDAFAIELEEDA